MKKEIKRRKYKFTENEEKEICSKYIQKIGIKEICKEYGFTSPVLYSILKNHNITYHGSPNIPDIETIKLIANDLDSGFTIENCSLKYDLSESCISKYLKRIKYKVINRTKFKQKYTLDENFLQEIDTPAKSQILGILYSDGTLNSNNKLISIRLQEDDKEYLEKINKEINSNKPLGWVKGQKFISPLNNKEYTGKNTIILDITNKKFYNDALKTGLVPRKTWANLGIPNIENHLKRGFVLGVFEGDGCITWDKDLYSFDLNFACSENMANDIYDIINQELNIKGSIRPTSSIFILHYQRITDIIKIRNWMYSGAAFYMQRKYDKFNKLFEIFKNKGYLID